MFFDPIEARVIDYVGGQRDLSDRVLRAIGDPVARFGEDHLRMLRAVRFAARFETTIEPATRRAIIEHAPLLASINGERVGDELRRMFTAPGSGHAYRLLCELALLPIILNGLPAFRGERLPVEKSVFLAAAAEGAMFFPACAFAHFIRQRAARRFGTARCDRTP